jgi:hypothetical protein
VSALTDLRRIKEQAIERIGAESTPVGGEFAFELSSALRNVERKIVQQEREQEEFRQDALETAFALRALYYEDAADPMFTLLRIQQVSEVMADPHNYAVIERPFA